MVYGCKLIPQPQGYAIENIEFDTPADSLDDASRQIPGGAYTTLRTYAHDRLLRWGNHIDRLVGGARSQGVVIDLDEENLRKTLRLLVNQFPASIDVRVRITLDLEEVPGAVYCTGEPLQVPQREYYQNGVDIVTCYLWRNMPEAKLTGFIATASEFRQSLPAGVAEALMVDTHGLILEGLSSNFFAVKEGHIFTAQEGVLAGITRMLVVQVVKSLGFDIVFQCVRVSEIPSLQEAFITSASRGIMPVRSIDGQLIGNGKPGEITIEVSTALEHQIESEIEPI